MGFSRQGYCSGLPYPSPGDLPNPGLKPRSSGLQADSSPSEPPGKQAMTKSLKFSTLPLILLKREKGQKWSWLIMPLWWSLCKNLNSMSSESFWISEHSHILRWYAPHFTGTEAPALRNLPNLTLYILSTGALSLGFTTTFNKLVNSSKCFPEFC